MITPKHMLHVLEQILNSFMLLLVLYVLNMNQKIKDSMRRTSGNKQIFIMSISIMKI